MNFIYRILISFFYIGYIRYAPGTLASIVMMIIFYYIPNNLIFQILLLIIIFLLGFILCYYHSKISSVKDPSFIVIDEIAGMSLSLFMLPKNFILYLVAFLLFRYLDIFKPSIINKSQEVSFGAGIMLDDLLSGVVTMIILWSIVICQYKLG